MEKVKHTPGPWEAGVNIKAEEHASNELVVRPKGEFPHGAWIADCGRSNDKEQRANACLIAAAPEILSALKMAMLWLRGDKYRFSDDESERLAWEEFMKSIYKAIEKAEGR
jgi:hypothetical protein